MKKVYSANESVLQEQRGHQNTSMHEKSYVKHGLRVKTGVKAGSDEQELHVDECDDHVYLNRV